MGTIKGSEKVSDFVFTRHRQGFRFHLAPFRNRFQIAPVSVAFSAHNVVFMMAFHNEIEWRF